MHPSRGAAVVLFTLLVAGFHAVSIRSVDSSIHGTVKDERGPIADALVRWQGTTTCTRSDAAGRYHLPGPRRQRPITAAQDGFLIAAGSSQAPHLRLLPAPQEDDDAYAWIDPAPDARQPFNCANCHVQIHQEWAGSAHGNSTKNPKFLHLFAGSDGSGPASKTWNLLHEHPLGSGVCSACHAPTLDSSELDYDIRKARDVAARGVHCDYCHKIADAPTDKLGTRFGRDGYRLARPFHGEQLFFGPLDDAVRPGESFVFAPFFKDSRYCASCHEGVIFGVHVYGTYSEWLASPARRQGRHCQDCHMAPTGAMTNIAPGKGGSERDPRTLASHHFPGATLEMLRQCLDVNTSATRQGSETEVNVAVQAKQVGHRVPTGFIDRHLILIVEGLDQQGQRAPLLEGPTLPARTGASFAGRPGWVYGKQHLSDQHRPLPFWRTAAELLDTRLHPEQPDVRRFVFAKDVPRVRVRLIYRKFWDEVAQERGWMDNDVVVVDATRDVTD
jgi:hypothetical protein